MKRIVIILFALALVFSSLEIARSEDEDCSDCCNYKIIGYANIRKNIGYRLANADAELIGPLGSQTVEANENGRYVIRVKAPCQVYRGNFIRVSGVNPVNGLQYAGDSKMFRMRGIDPETVVIQHRNTRVRVVK